MIRRQTTGIALVVGIVGLVVGMAGTAAEAAVVVNDHFEGAWPGAWQVRSDDANDPRWGRSTWRFWSGWRSLHCTASGPNATSRGANYTHNINGDWLVYGPINLSNAADCTFSFKAWRDTETTNDVLEAGLSLDDATYEFVGWSGRSRAWKTYTITARDGRFATDYTGHAGVYFAVRFRSNSSVAYQGVYVDDVRIETTPSAGDLTVRVEDAGHVGVANVRVTLSPTGREKLTDANGECVFERLAAGTYTVTPSGLGATYNPTSRQITMSGSNVSTAFTATVPPPTGMTCYGICIGVTSNLSYPDDDARDMRDALIARGWPAGNIITLVDNAPTTQAVHDAIDQVIAQADNDDLVLFFQSCHGGRRTDQAPIDEADGLDEYITTANGLITDDNLSQWFAGLQTMKLITIFDSCYAGGMFVNGVRESSEGWAADFAGEVHARLQQMHALDMNDWGGGVSIASSADTELSYENPILQNGVLAYYVVEAIRENLADVSSNGWISAEEVFAWAAPRITSFESRMHPQMFDGHSGELDFVPTSILQQAGGSPVAGPLTVSAVASGTPAGAAISLQLSAAATVRCEIVNIAGRRIAVLPEAVLTAGAHTLLWNGRNAGGSRCPVGAYVVRVTARDSGGQLARTLAVLRKR